MVIIGRSQEQSRSHAYTVAEQQHIVHGLTLKRWVEQASKASAQSLQNEHHTQECAKIKQYSNLRDSPPMSLGIRDTSVRCAHRNSHPARSSAQAAVILNQTPTDYDRPLSARARRRAAERPRYISKGSSQRAVGPRRAYGQHREAGLRHD